MSAWSKLEAQRTIEEVKRRSAEDLHFRALALSDPIAALAKINPRPVPVGSVRFVEAKDAMVYASDTQAIIAILPEPGMADEELSDLELESVAGGGDSNPPPEGGGKNDPPVGSS